MANPQSTVYWVSRDLTTVDLPNRSSATFRLHRWLRVLPVGSPTVHLTEQCIQYADRVMNPPVEHRGILLTSSTWTVPVLAPAPTLTIPLDPGEIPVPYALLHTRMWRRKVRGKCPSHASSTGKLRAQQLRWTKYMPSRPQDQFLAIKVPENPQN